MEGRDMQKHFRRAPTPDKLAVKIKRGSASEEDKALFYELIINLVRKFAHKYASTIKDLDFGDLENLGFTHLYASLKTFDSHKAKLSTWAWYCLYSAYNREYELYKERRRMGLFSDMCSPNANDDDEAPADMMSLVEGPSEDIILRVFVKNVIQDVFKKWERERAILKAMFGNPFANEYEIPNQIRITDIASDLGVQYSKVFVFWSRHVRPYLQERMCEFEPMVRVE
jgi:hypothetical protein